MKDPADSIAPGGAAGSNSPLKEGTSKLEEKKVSPEPASQGY